MGRSRYRILQSQHPHFLTCTVLNWMPLFTRPATVQRAGGFVLPPATAQLATLWLCDSGNSLALLVQVDDLPNQLAHVKSYTARQLIDYLQAVKAERLLQQLRWFRKAHKSDRDYQCWEEGSHPQLIGNPEVLRQKLAYIHLNPVKRGYVDLPGLVLANRQRGYLRSHAARGNEIIHFNEFLALFAAIRLKSQFFKWPPFASWTTTISIFTTPSACTASLPAIWSNKV